MSLFRVKPLDQLLGEAEHGEQRLKRSLGAMQLTSLGISAIIGAGIFSTVGTAAAGGASHLGAGPALVISFVLVAIACGFAALCYAEFAAMVPVSGSAYTYAYATLGELVAWIIGWDLIIEYAVGNVAVAISWSGYFQELLRGFGVEFPGWLGIDYRSAAQAARQLAEAQAAQVDLTTLGVPVERAAAALASAPVLAGIPIVFNLPAFLIVMLITWVLVIGISESAWFAFVLVALGILVLRRTDPARPRPFRTPFVPVVPILAILSCAYLMFELPLTTWIRFGVWLAIGLVIYLMYGMRHSALGRVERGVQTGRS